MNWYYIGSQFFSFFLIYLITGIPKTEKFISTHDQFLSMSDLSVFITQEVPPLFEKISHKKESQIHLNGPLDAAQKIGNWKGVHGLVMFPIKTYGWPHLPQKKRRKKTPSTLFYFYFFILFKSFSNESTGSSIGISLSIALGYWEFMS